MVRGNYLYVAYYGAGLRCFDISNPYAIVETGKVESYRDPDGNNINGSGSYDRSSTSSTVGAWNLYTFLPSGRIILSDRYGGLFIVQANAPYAIPSSPVGVQAVRNENGDITVSWDDDTTVRGYSVERSLDGSVYTLVVEHLVSNSYFDSGPDVQGNTVWYRVIAVNGEGSSAAAVVEVPILSPFPSMFPSLVSCSTPFWTVVL